LAGAVLMPVSLYFFKKPPVVVWWGIFACALVFLRHSENIKRLIGGKERKIGKKERD